MLCNELKKNIAVQERISCNWMGFQEMDSWFLLHLHLTSNVTNTLLNATAFSTERRVAPKFKFFIYIKTSQRRSSIEAEVSLKQLTEVSEFLFQIRLIEFLS